jgi:predicted site-specific integrase-resolvase
MSKLYSAKAAAQRLGVGKTTVNRWLREGYFPNAYQLNPDIPTSPYRIPEEDIEAIERKRHPVASAD